MCVQYMYVYVCVGESAYVYVCRIVCVCVCVLHCVAFYCFSAWVQFITATPADDNIRPRQDGRSPPRKSS